MEGFKLPAFVIAGCHSTLAAQRKLALNKMVPSQMMREASVYFLSDVGVTGCKALGRMDNLKTERAARFKTSFIDTVRKMHED